LEKIRNPALELIVAFEFMRRRPVAHSIIVHFEDEVPVQLEERFVNPALAPDYHRQDFAATTTYDYLQRATPLTEVEHVISAIAVDEVAAGRLMIRPGDPCLLLHRRTWSGAA
ncbi:MAG: UTRA domain-containing protein, partial [Mesorhizobium sp.]